MRSTLFKMLIGCGLMAAVSGPALACSFNTQASSDSQQQQTAQAQTGSTTTAQ